MLFYIKEKVEKTLHISSETSALMSDEKFECTLGSSTFSIRYEPKYWMPRHSKAMTENLLNTEGWTIRNNKPSERGHYGINSKRSPDYVFCTKNNAKTIYYVLDAKYTIPDKAFTKYLPELALKYLHGLYDPYEKNRANRINNFMS